MNFYGAEIIYKATNKINGKVYIGQTINSLETRKKQHIDRALSNYDNKKSRFGCAIRKYTPENFSWEIIDTCDLFLNHEVLDCKECYWIDFYSSCNSSKGYNMHPGGGIALGIVNRGRKQSPEQIAFRVSFLKGKPAWNKGKKDYLSEQSKTLQSQNSKSSWTPERHEKHKNRMIENNPMDHKEYRDKISFKNTGREVSQKERNSISSTLKEYFKTHDSPMRGNTHREESKKKNSETRIRNGKSKGKNNPRYKDIDLELLFLLRDEGMMMKDMASYFKATPPIIRSRLRNPERYR
jgi:group I intron endonuclease